MSTNSSIGIKRRDGSETRIYCHWDGYIAHNGVTLQLAYNTAEKVEALLALGDLSSLGYYPDRVPGNDADEVSSDCCVAYHRDRGEEFRQSPGKREFNYTFYEEDALWVVEDEIYTKGTPAMRRLVLDCWWFYKSRFLLDAILELSGTLDDPDRWESDEFAEAGAVTAACVAKAQEARREIIDRERAEYDAYYSAYCD